jgi:tetratricopeptide (TPR) repeat protein
VQECDKQLLKQPIWNRQRRGVVIDALANGSPAYEGAVDGGRCGDRHLAGLTGLADLIGFSRLSRLSGRAGLAGFAGLVVGFVLVLGITGCGCSRTVKPAGSNPSSPEGVVVSDRKPLKPEDAQKAARSAFPWLEAGVNVDGKPLSVSGGGRNTARKPGEEFNRRYSEGLQFMETEKLGDALKIFEDIIKNYPGTEEASMAEYRVAQIHFKNKSNQAALESYKRIVTQYPSSPIAENARAAITYLESFEKHESTYVSPEADDKRRRGF